MTTNAAPPAPAAPEAPTQPPPAPAPPAAPPAPPAPQKPAGDPRPRSQRTAAPPPAPSQSPANEVVNPPPAPPAPPQEPPAPPPAPPAPPEPTPKPPKTEEQLRQEIKDQDAARDAAAANQLKLESYRALVKDGKVNFRDLLEKEDVTRAEILSFVDNVLDNGLEAGKVVAAEEFSGQVDQELADEYDGFKEEIVNSFYAQVPTALQPEFQAAVVGKRAGDWVKGLLDLAPKLPSVQQAFYEGALSTAKELVPEASKADFDRELEGASKDLKGLLHAAYQSGFLTRAPNGAPVARPSGGGAMDIQRWRTDRAWRRTLSREENNAYHAESNRLQGIGQ